MRTFAFALSYIVRKSTNWTRFVWYSLVCVRLNLVRPLSGGMRFNGKFWECALWSGSVGVFCDLWAGCPCLDASAWGQAAGCSCVSGGPGVFRCWLGSRQWNRVGTRADKTCVVEGCGWVWWGCSKGKNASLMQDDMCRIRSDGLEARNFVHLFIRSQVWAAVLLISQVAGFGSLSSKTKKVKLVHDSWRRLTS